MQPFWFGAKLRVMQVTAMPNFPRLLTGAGAVICSGLPYTHWWSNTWERSRFSELSIPAASTVFSHRHQLSDWIRCRVFH